MLASSSFVYVYIYIHVIYVHESYEIHVVYIFAFIVYTLRYPQISWGPVLCSRGGLLVFPSFVPSW